MTVIAESTPEWNDRLRSNGWIEVGTFGAPDEKPSVRLWMNRSEDREYFEHRVVTGLVYYAIQVFSGERCRHVEVIPKINTMTRSAVSIGGGLYRTSFYEVGFVAPKANTYKATERAKWTMDVKVGAVNDCPE